MRINTYRWTEAAGWDDSISQSARADLVIAYSDSSYFKSAACYDDLRGFFPQAKIVGCSSAGNILNATVSDDDIVVAAIELEATTVVVESRVLENQDDVGTVSNELIRELINPELKHIFLLSDGLFISGSELTRNLNNFPIPVTGGLAGDGDRFGESWVMANGPARQHQLVFIGLYGKLDVRYGFSTGWKEFGPERKVTKSDKNVVYEIDYKPALDIYVSYLGELSKDLPSSGLRFPLSIKANELGVSAVRTLLGVDREAKSLIFAGDIPQGSLCKLMKTDVDSLIDASAELASELAAEAADKNTLCLIVSCVGRRLVMAQIAEEELDAIQNILGQDTTIFGFYSYGEIAPFEPDYCALHNQTTTLTLLSE
jgi:hypothetical protein